LARPPVVQPLGRPAVVKSSWISSPAKVEEQNARAS